jgi:hypothetical protein
MIYHLLDNYNHCRVKFNGYAIKSANSFGSYVELVRQSDSHFRSDCHFAHFLQMIHSFLGLWGRGGRLCWDWFFREKWILG